MMNNVQCKTVKLGVCRPGLADWIRYSVCDVKGFVNADLLRQNWDKCGKIRNGKGQLADVLM